MNTVTDKKLLEEKWTANGDKLKLNEIKDKTRREVTIRLLENQHNQLQEDINVTSQIANYDPVVIKMVRRITPQLIAYDVVGVQPLTLPTGLGFALRAKYPDTGHNFKNGKEALFDSVDTSASGTGTHDFSENPFGDVDVLAKTGQAMDTATGETAEWKSMGVEIDRVQFVAKTRQLRADYSLEIEKDMRSVHGLDAASEMANILTNEITLETNQEIIRTLYHVAQIGAKATNTPGTFDYNAETDGRWAGERALGLWTFIEREANRLALLNRRGRGNFVITSSDVATMLSFAGVLKNDTRLQTNMDIDIIGSSYAGTAGRLKVFIDPMLEHNGVLIGYKGFNEYDAGIFYAPYVPLAAQSGVNVVNGFKKAIGFQTRYAVGANPFTKFKKGQNVYYTKFKIDNL